MDKSISYLRSLEKLDLELNLITVFETETFNVLANLARLADLNLDANPIIILKNYLFNKLSRLTTLKFLFHLHN